MYIIKCVCVCFLLFPSVASRAFKDIISALLASPKFRDSAQVRPCRSKNVNHIHACPPSPSACGPYSFSHRPTSLARFARSKRDSWAEDFQEKVERVFLKGISQSSATDFGSKDWSNDFKRASIWHKSQCQLSCSWTRGPKLQQWNTPFGSLWILLVQ